MLFFSFATVDDAAVFEGEGRDFVFAGSSFDLAEDRALEEDGVVAVAAVDETAAGHGDRPVDGDEVVAGAAVDDAADAVGDGDGVVAAAGVNAAGDVAEGELVVAAAGFGDAGGVAADVDDVDLVAVVGDDSPFF